MIIYFLRHASAGQKKPNPKKDEKRPLDDEGIRQTTEMGRVLSAMQSSVDAVISSPLKRATQTAALVANEIGYEGKLHIENALRPEGKYEQFREMLRRYSRQEAILLVGHNPNFSRFLGNLIADNGGRAHVDLKKGAVARVESEQKRMVLQWMLTPRLLRAAAEAGVNESVYAESGTGVNMEVTEKMEKNKKAKGRK